MQMEAWTLLDGGSQLYALIHEATIRRELILWFIKDDEIYISIVAVMKDKYVFSSTVEEDFSKEKP